MRVEIDIDEKWPVFSLSYATDDKVGGVLTNLPDGFVERFLQIQEDYENMQNIIRDIYDSHTRGNASKAS